MAVKPNKSQEEKEHEGVVRKVRMCVKVDMLKVSFGKIFA
jgi:hypothetical protein